MDPRGSFPHGDIPDDGDLPLRGWLSPDDRLWRHPSEIASSADRPAGGNGSGTQMLLSDEARRTFLSNNLLLGLVGATAIVVVVASAMVMFNTERSTGGSRLLSSNGPITFDQSPTSQMSLIPLSYMAQLINRLRPSLVEVSGNDGSPLGTAVVLPGGESVVTAIGITSSDDDPILMTSTGERRQGRLIGTDPEAGVAVYSIGPGSPLEPAAFSPDDADPGWLVTACLCGQDTAGRSEFVLPRTLVGLAMVEQVGETPQAQTGLVDAIQAEVPFPSGAGGSVLLNSSGEVSGILAGTEQGFPDRSDAREDASGDQAPNAPVSFDTPVSTVSSISAITSITTLTSLTEPASAGPNSYGSGTASGLFVPGWLAEGVGEQLADSRQVGNGWLGIKGSSVSTGCGSTVISVFQGSPAQSGGIGPGSIINQVDGHLVCTMAALEARINIQSVGSTVELGLSSPSGESEVSVTLAGKPGVVAQG